MHCSSLHSTILENGVYLIFPMSKPNMKCYCRCLCGNLKFAYNRHGCKVPLLFAHFANSWSLGVCDRIVGIILACGLMTCFNVIYSLCLQLIRAINAAMY
jgi:hypothetical protein